jgi:hypothetical protein
MMCFSNFEPGTCGPRRIAAADLEAAFAARWHLESVIPARFQTIPEFIGLFSQGGPQAWFVVAQRA